MKTLSRIFVTLSLMLLVGCEGGEATELAESAAPAVDVWVVPVRAETIVEPIIGTGSIAAQKTSNIGPRVDGIIEEIHVHVGDRVEAGAPLFRTRDIDHRIRVDEAKHAFRLARAEAEKASRDWKRVEKLATEGVASSEQLDVVRTNDEIAAARLGAAQNALDSAKQNLSDTLVVAPYAGVVTARLVDEGVMMRTMLSSNSHVVQLMKIDVVAAIVQVPALHLASIKLGTRATLHIDGLPQPYEGEVLILNDRIDLASRAFEVRIPIKNDDLAVKPGLFVRAELRPEGRQALVVERRAVLGANGGRYVFTSKDATATKQAVEVRDLDAARFEVISGLAAGDQVLTGPSLPRLVEGTPIAVRTTHVDF